MLVLSPRRGDVGVPALGHPPARELHIARVEGSLELQQQHRLFDVENAGHSSITLATPGAIGHDRGVAAGRRPRLCNKCVQSLGTGREAAYLRPMTRRRHRRSALIPVLTVVAGFVAGTLGIALLSFAIGGLSPIGGCSGSAGASSGTAGSIVLGPPGSGIHVGATEYGGPGDPSSGVVGSSGANLLEYPDSYAELGGDTFQTATAMGGLPYMTPLRISWGAHSAIAYKRDIGFGGGPIGGLPRVIDLWWELARRLGVPYEHGLWSGPVEIERPPSTGAASLLGQDPVGPAGADHFRERVRRRVERRAAAHARAPCDAVAERACGGARRRAGGGQGHHRGRERDRRQAVCVRRRARAAAVADRAGVRLLEQRLAPALGRRAAVGDRRRDLGRARVVRAARTGPVGHDLRERRARVRVCGRAQVGHAQRRRTG